MKINEQFALRHTMGIDYSFSAGKDGANSKIVSFNGPAALLRDRLEGRDFELQDVVDILLEEYEVEEATARKDAETWVNQMKEMKFITD